MSINIRTKGQTGEREICELLNGILWKVCQEQGLAFPTVPMFQRNQNQSAVGGSDITNPYGLAIEVKRHETLSVEAWWKQCVNSSREHGGKPVLLYRQNGKRNWHCMMEGWVSDGVNQHRMRVEISHEDFLVWAHAWISTAIRSFT